MRALVTTFFYEGLTFALRCDHSASMDIYGQDRTPPCTVAVLTRGTTLKAKRDRKPDNRLFTCLYVEIIQRNQCNLNVFYNLRIVSIRQGCSD